MAGQSDDLPKEVKSMSAEEERVYDPLLGKIITRLKKTAPTDTAGVRGEGSCIKQAEEILRQASTAHP